MGNKPQKIPDRITLINNAVNNIYVSRIVDGYILNKPPYLDELESVTSNMKWKLDRHIFYDRVYRNNETRWYHQFRNKQLMRIVCTRDYKFAFVTWEWIIS